MVHQPHFLPWPGYLARCLSVDLFVLLDNVKFNRNHYQQRSKFIDKDGRLRWLSLPIERATRSKDISNVRIASEFQLKKWQRVLVESYREATHFEPIWNDVTGVIERQCPNFCDVAQGTLELVIKYLAEAASLPMVQMIRSSTIESSENRTDRLIDICSNQGITHLVMGGYALESHDVDLLKRSSIRLIRQHYVGPESSRPIPGVTGLHYIMHDGPERTATNLKSHWALRDIAL